MISVVIPFFNSSSYLADALKSVVRQSVNSLEVILVDDGSQVEESARCVDIINSFSILDISYHKTLNGGASSARNFGVSQSKYDLIAFLDSDDYWLDNKLSIQIDMLVKGQYDLMLGNVIVCDEHLTHRYLAKKSLATTSKSNIERFYKGWITMNTPTILLKKDLFKEIGGFNESLRYREDHFFLMKAADIGRIGLASEFLTLRRERENSLSGVGDFEGELSKHLPFLDLGEKEYNFLNKNLALTQIVFRLGFFYLRNNKNDDFYKALKFLGRLSKIFQSGLLILFVLKPFSNHFLMLRDKIRNVIK